MESDGIAVQPHDVSTRASILSVVRFVVVSELIVLLPQFRTPVHISAYTHTLPSQTRQYVGPNAFNTLPTYQDLRCRRSPAIVDGLDSGRRRILRWRERAG